MSDTHFTEPVDSTVTITEITQAWDNWLTFHRGINCEETMERFFTYCHSVPQSFVDDLLDWEAGCVDERCYDDTRHVASSTAQRVKMLAGPYFNAVVSAYYAKHPWK